MARNVGDKDAKMRFVIDKEIVKVPGHLTHGNVASCDLQPGKFWNIARKRGGLDRTGNFQFLMQSLEPFFGGESAMGDDVAEATDEYQEAKKLKIGTEAFYKPKAGEKMCIRDSVWDCCWR